MNTNKITAGLVVFFSLLIAFYVGTASLVTVKQLADYDEAKKLERLTPNTDSVKVIYDGIVFKNKAEMTNFINDLKNANINKIIQCN